VEATKAKVEEGTVKLFRYFGSHAYETLSSGQLLVSQLSKFNDPFEFYYQLSDLTPKQARQIVRYTLKTPGFLKELRSTMPGMTSAQRKKVLRDLRTRAMLAENLAATETAQKAFDQKAAVDRMDKSARLCCFSSADVAPFDEILLWSHYADKHKGVRIGFELPLGPQPDFTLKRVDYSKHRILVPMDADVKGQKVQSALKAAMFTKAEGWRYENEYRILVPHDRCAHGTSDKGEPQSFMNFEPGVLWTVDFGVLCPEPERVRIASLVRKKFPKATVRVASRHETDFALTYSSI
jgi:hypothetical protein